MVLSFALLACPRARVVPPIRLRSHLGELLKGLHFTGPAVELGTQKGEFTTVLLSGWGRCSLYVQVDSWAPLQNYKDAANKDAVTHLEYKQQALSKLQRMERSHHTSRGVQCHNLTSVCARRFPNGFFDFIYVDARHDRLGVLEDLATWWPLLRPGGIIAGHDYTEQKEPFGTTRGTISAGDPEVTGQDWTINYDGTRDATRRAVKGAVDDFFAGVAPDGHGAQVELRRCPLQVVVTYREMGWNTWLVAKPGVAQHASLNASLWSLHDIQGRVPPGEEVRWCCCVLGCSGCPKAPSSATLGTQLLSGGSKNPRALPMCSH